MSAIIPKFVTWEGQTYPYFQTKQDAEQALLAGTIVQSQRVLIHQSNFPGATAGQQYVYQKGLALTPLQIAVGLAIIVFVVVGIIVALVAYIMFLKLNNQSTTKPIGDGNTLVTSPSGESYVIDRSGKVVEGSKTEPNLSAFESVANVGQSAVKVAGLAALGLLGYVGFRAYRGARKAKRTVTTDAVPVSDTSAGKAAPPRRRLRAPSMRAMRGAA